MTLQKTIKVMEVVASKQPSINMIVENDIFRLNEKSDAKYGVFSFVQGQHSSSIDGTFLNLQFTLFYVDRLKTDLSNQIEIQSVGIDTLDNILRTLNDGGVYVDSYTFTPFNQRFLDECSGVFCNVTMQVPIGSLCHEIFADFNDDFNDDFLIF